MKVLLLTLLLMPQIGWTADWWINPPIEDEKYRYYLGVSDSCPQLKACLDQAFDDALKSAIRENFGFLTNVQSDTYLTDKSDSTVTRVREITGQVHLTGFEKFKSYINDSKKEALSVRVLYRIPKLEIAAEKVRLSGLPHQIGLDPKADSLEVQSPRYKGGIDIKTDPPGAMVSLDSTALFESPVWISGQIKPGRHIVTIDHPQYETIEQTIVILPGQIAKLRQTLIPAKGHVSINTNYPGAKVFINNHLMGRTPLPSIELFATEDYQIRFEKEDCYPVAINSFKISKNETKEEMWTLKKLVGRILIQTNALDAEISVEDGKLASSKGMYLLEVGTHEVHVRAPGYEEQVISFEVFANQTKSLQVILKKTDAVKPQSLNPSRDGKPWYLPKYFYTEVNGTYLGFGDKNYDSRLIPFAELYLGLGAHFAYSIGGGAYQAPSNYMEINRPSTNHAILSAKIRRDAVWLTNDNESPSGVIGIGYEWGWIQGDLGYVNDSLFASQAPVYEKYLLKTEGLALLFLSRTPGTVDWSFRLGMYRSVSNNINILSNTGSYLTLGLGVDWLK